MQVSFGSLPRRDGILRASSVVPRNWRISVEKHQAAQERSEYRSTPRYHFRSPAAAPCFAEALSTLLGHCGRSKGAIRYWKSGPSNPLRPRKDLLELRASGTDDTARIARAESQVDLSW